MIHSRGASCAYDSCLLRLGRLQWRPGVLPVDHPGSGGSFSINQSTISAVVFLMVQSVGERNDSIPSAV